MAGIYIHIPYCRKACHYCDFHFSTTLTSSDVMVDAIVREAELMQVFLEEPPATLYFGGGTPSLLSRAQLLKVFGGLEAVFDLSRLKEVTFEANPDDLIKDKLEVLYDLGVDRLSIGIQSFFDEDLTIMNRSHDRRQARNAIEFALARGFEKMSIDLIYGQPWSNNFGRNLEAFLEYDIGHLSAYALTVEEKTALHFQIKKGLVPPVSEEHALHDFEHLQMWAGESGYEHYEVSNLTRNGKYGIHNSNYWKGEAYLGLGPAAHSYNGQCRYWNVANNQKYLKSISSNVVPHEKEVLSLNDMYNEYLLIGLRTMWGVEEQKIKSFGETIYAHFLSEVERLRPTGIFRLENGRVFLSKDAMFRADGAARELFYVDSVVS